MCIRDRGVGVERCRVRHLFAVGGDVAVGLVADEEDVVAENFALFGQDAGQTAQGLGGVDDAGGIHSLFRKPPLHWRALHRHSLRNLILL